MNGDAKDSMEIKRIVKSIADKITDIFPIGNIIMFESSPDYSDNTKAVFDEMLKRGLTI